MTEDMLRGEARIVEDGPRVSMEAEIAAIKRKYNGGIDERMEKCQRDRKAPPIDERGDWFYGKMTLPHVRQRQADDFEKRVGGIYGRSGNDFRGAVLEFAPVKSGPIKHGRLMKIDRPGEADAQALIGWLHVQDMTHNEVIDMTQEPWPLPNYVARVIVQPRAGAA